MAESLYKFVPFSEQYGPAKAHIIPLEVDFSDIDLDPIDSGLKHIPCDVGFKRVIGDYEFGWGDREKLTLVVKKTPFIECDCSKYLENPVMQRILSKGRKILHFIELDGEQGKDSIGEFLEEDDFKKVEDFTYNRWRLPEIKKDR